jgi:hypothetical protein
MIFLTRKAEFSSAHYYWNDAWSPEENQRVFGKCANRNGHGHNYTLEVTVAGEVDLLAGENTSWSPTPSVPVSIRPAIIRRPSKR